MKKQGITIFFILILFLLVSCSNKNKNMTDFNNQQSQNNTSANDSIKTTDNHEAYYDFLIKNIDILFPDKKIINWVMPNAVMSDITDQQIIDFDNKLISNANTDYVLQFVLANNMFDYCLVIDKMISDGVNIDIFTTGPYSLGVVGNASLMLDPYYYFYNKGYLYNLDGYLLSGKGSKLYNSNIQKMWEALKIDDSIYGIRTDYFLNSDYTISVDNDTATQHSIDLSKFTSDISSIEDAAKIITKATGKPSIELGNSLAAISNYLGYKYVCGTVVIDKDTNKAVNLFETDKFVHYISTIRWFVQSGLIDPDIFNNGSNAQITFSTTNSNLFSAVAYTAELYPLTVTSQRTALCIYKDAVNPIDALDLLTLLHSNTEFADCLVYGKSDTAPILFRWFSSLYFSTSLHNDEVPELRDKISTFNEGIELDKYSTYHFNTIPLEETLNNIDKILCDYIYPIVDKSKTESVQVYCSFITGHDEDPMKTLEEVNTKMENAGLDTLIDAVNKSLGNK